MGNIKQIFDTKNYKFIDCCSFFSKFLIQRNTVENIFKPNILQTLLGRKKRDIVGVEFSKGTH